MQINSLLSYFILTLVFSFLIGLELKAYQIKYHSDTKKNSLGTTRTYTFLGMLGFILYKLDTTYFSVYISGFFAFTLLFAILYNKYIDEKMSIILYLVLLVVYSFGPLINLYPVWFSSLIFVITIFLLNSKERNLRFKIDINLYELETIGKIVLLLAVILPLLPQDKNIPYLEISAYKIWLTVVVIALISYISYIIQKYIFPSKGMFLMGLLGGIYSSTATIIVISKKALCLKENNIIGASIFAAILMMYFRVLFLTYLFNKEVAMAILIPLIFLILITLALTLGFYFKSEKISYSVEAIDTNPLELRTAFIFAILFVLTMFITNLVIENFGLIGLQFLSVVVGFSDINPFILSLLTAKYSVTTSTIASSILIAIGSNNILISFYSLFFGKDKTKIASILLALLGFITILVGFIL
ncbi:beta-carotene 15,15'-monooxygenase [Aliarcobacter trophiarum LMG 25534]|uniref:Beta-carotene 15,15'-monooxygenase n=1 Tax=Aliarcobacter trophiarum LMG 25534 TaxID=1032241 RepID=A0AAD0VL53_9BACT|nr:DUF4010 domain-containing protein [Aliarcobacter trophiarum]AXK47913.1 DUF4010 domain-containing membrane protein [Aliarcobacter trophiarum LMG 25534]RXI28121.1 beta-carotene 15,15'-monooxygenase [Aliarcobacter trophiarum]RXJ92425.1 beta-carotene 15,15'-monooxygenase [Aliarcobacter trophiarum LMG 25534]